MLLLLPHVTVHKVDRDLGTELCMQYTYTLYTDITNGKESGVVVVLQCQLGDEVLCVNHGEQE